MKISNIYIENFRNFKNIDVKVDEDIVLVGENGVGKTNFIYALRLVLDPSLSEKDRHLSMTDYWDGLNEITMSDRIKIAIEFETSEDDDPNLLSKISDFVIAHNPLKIRLTYEFKPLKTLVHNPKTDEDFEFYVYGGNNPNKKFNYYQRKWIPLSVLNGLRDAERDLAVWSKSPLKYLIKEATDQIDINHIKEISDEIKVSSNQIKEFESIDNLVKNINSGINEIIGINDAIDITLGIAPVSPIKLMRSLKLLLDNGERTISDTSLGIANLLYISLKNQEISTLIKNEKRYYNFLCIEEPEAHLHPHYQRLVYRNFLQEREHIISRKSIEDKKSMILTTHSPHIVSVTPINSIIMLKNDNDNGTQVYSGIDLCKSLNQSDLEDLERYLDVKRGEIMFAKKVILVEGESEEYLVPVLAKHFNVDLDKHGVTICSINGTNFAPYVKLLEIFKIPYTVITDLDPVEDNEPLALNRIRKILKIKNSNDNVSTVNLIDIAKQHNIYINNKTLEVELFRSGIKKSMTKVFCELTDNQNAKERFEKWHEDISTLDENSFLKDISSVGKGRYAQRLSTKLLKQLKKGSSYPDACPQYIKEAVNNVISR